MILSFDGKEIKDSNELPYRVAATPVGKVASVEVMRNGQKKNFQVKIVELQEARQPRRVGKAKSGLNLGMHVEALTPEIARSFGLSETSGVVVVEMVDGGPAAEAGVQPGDIILEVDQNPVKDLEQFNRKVQSFKPGDTILFFIKRQGATLFLTLKVGE